MEFKQVEIQSGEPNGGLLAINLNLNTTTSGLKEMHPIDLMRKYDWSYSKLAEEFGVSEVEARRWGFRKTASNYRNPPQMAYKLAQKIDKELSLISASEYSSNKTIFRTIAT